MHLFVGALAVPAALIYLLYCWLVGAWFARVLMFLLIFFGFFLLDCIVFAAPNGKFVAILLLPIAGGAAWIIASIPIYVHERRSYRAMGAQWTDEWERRAAAGHSRRGYR